VGLNELVHNVLKVFLGLQLFVCDYSGCPVVEVGRQECLGAINHKEGCVNRGPTGGHP
jgi:hypothetical protein